MTSPTPTADTAAIPAPASSLAGACALSDWGVIRAIGADAASFLNGQLTQEVLRLGDEARLAGYCSAKGRLLASFVVWQPAVDRPDELLLACSADLLPAVLKRLSMFVLRAKCRLTDASAEVRLVGLAGDAAMDWLGEAAPPRPWSCRRPGEAQVVRLPDARVDGAAVPRALLAQPAAADLPLLAALSPEAWAWLEVASGVVRIVAATSEHFVPQMVNLELVGGVNFQKGCYPGQEVVARSQYRGTLKRRMVRLTGPSPLQPGQELYHSADPGQPCGEVALAASWQGRHGALAELKIASVGGPGSLHAGAADGPLVELAALPYPVPLEAA